MVKLSLVTLHAEPSAQSVPLAAACLKAHLDSCFCEQGHPLSVSMPEYFPAVPLDQILTDLCDLQPDIIGFPVYIWNHERVMTLAGLLKKRLPGVVLLAGGPEVTADPFRVLGEAPFDTVVIGEGEETMAELCERLLSGQPFMGVAGTAWLADDKEQLLARPQMRSLDKLASPYLMGLLDEHIRQGMVWQLSRGCPFACEFCYDGMGDRSVRRYPLERLEQELRYFVERGASQIFALDSTFNTDRPRAKHILRLIEQEAPAVHFHFEVRHELLDREQAELFASLTCSLQIGLQSADPQVAGGVGRPFDRESFRRKVMLLNDSGATFGFDLIYGLPGDTLDTFSEGLDFALSLYPNHLDIFILSVLPGTKLFQRAAELGLQSLSEAPYTLVSTPHFPPHDLARAGSLATATDIFYSRGKAVAWFNGVCRALGVRPITLISGFADWLVAQFGEVPDESSLDDQAIWQLQRRFLTEQFNDRPAQGLAAVDCVDYHYAYGVALMAIMPEPGDMRLLQGKRLLNLPLVCPPSVTRMSFSYEILEILESGEPDPRWIAKHLRPVGSQAIIYPARGEVRTESLIPAYMHLLALLDGTRTAKQLLATIGLSADDTLDFLVFAYEEGVVVEPDRVPPAQACY